MTQTSALPRLYPFLNRTLLRHRRHIPVKQMAVKAEEISPANTSYFPSVIMLDGELDRVVKLQHQTTKQQNQNRIQGGMYENAATWRYTFRNVFATLRGQYTLGYSLNHMGLPPLRSVLEGGVPRFEKGCCALSGMGYTYFGHWMKDCLPTTLLCRPDETLFLPAHDDWHHAHGYDQALGLGVSRCHHAYFDEMTLIYDVGQNASRHARIAQIHDRLREGMTPTGANGVFIRRGATGAQRVLTNEDEIADMLAAKGFNICSATDDLDTIRRACHDVPILVTMEGSHHANGFFGSRRGALNVILNPADRFNCLYAEFMPALDQRMATLVAEQVEGGYRVDPDRLMRLMDKALSELS